ncbi:MAG: hypothetical protein KAJ55_11305 [Anaerolineales bacterium]|nr:hypothetical protein [Anaerolineales bacterium]
MKFGYFRTDESSHNYLVPEEVINDFDRDMETMDELAATNDMSPEFYAACNHFETEFGQYRIDGISNYKVVMP